MDALDVDGAWVLTPRIHADGRGSFLEWFRDTEFQEDLGYRMDVAQANCSYLLRPRP
ncbi:MAG: dTDP-4-dehydrorhamnose 3,5-epimerase family protein [Streptosporangiaceae bacterium]